VGLVLGSLAFVVLAVALIPERLGVTPGSEQDALALGVAHDEHGSSEAAGPAGAKRRSRGESHPSLPAAPQHSEPPKDPEVPSFFQAPALELPAPLEEPEPPAAPEPAPTATEMTLPPAALALPPSPEPHAEPPEVVPQ
jgi:hypothetical protein